MAQPQKAADRRTFLKATGAAAFTAACAPVVLGAKDKAGTKTPVIGTGEHTYECHHGWGEVPDYIRWERRTAWRLMRRA
jgi:hypothetical protein